MFKSNKSSLPPVTQPVQQAANPAAAPNAKPAPATNPPVSGPPKSVTPTQPVPATKTGVEEMNFNLVEQATAAETREQQITALEDSNKHLEVKFQELSTMLSKTVQKFGFEVITVKQKNGETKQSLKKADNPNDPISSKLTPE